MSPAVIDEPSNTKGMTNFITVFFFSTFLAISGSTDNKEKNHSEHHQHIPTLHHYYDHEGESWESFHRVNTHGKALLSIHEYKADHHLRNDFKKPEGNELVSE